MDKVRRRERTVSKTECRSDGVKTQGYEKGQDRTQPVRPALRLETGVRDRGLEAELHEVWGFRKEKEC